jgi:gamma-glutamylcyclotransferase (GGCT)/AIG2-like uncharacterized protein YtfP
MLRVFVYGTLQSGQRNHQRYCQGVISIEPATVRGRLYDLPQGYPMLAIPGEGLAVGTREAAADVALQQQLARHSSDDASDAQAPDDDDWQSIHGEILSFDDAEIRLPLLDELEGFHPGGPSLYVRVLVRSQQGEVVWTYVAPDGRVPPGARRTGMKWPNRGQETGVRNQ